MKENKHTPGPWRATLANQNTMTFQYDPPKVLCGAKLIALCHHDDDANECSVPLKESEANAQLIAESPAMLEALEWFVEFAAQHPEWTENFLAHEDSAEREWFNAVRQAIAKAKGGV